jgi:octaprenyl-diphosphate synthase
MALAGLAEVSEDPLVARLSSLCERRGLAALAARMAELGRVAGADLAAVEAVLAGLPRHPAIVVESAHHLLSLGGKRLRPLCVALAARTGGRGFSATARELAVAVELVHSATLLHDDVVDVGELRRGAPTARVIWGNAASIFAGDWLLVEALARVGATGVPDASERLLAVLREMILAESAQLEARGCLRAERAAWLHVVEGKTASLFRWAMWAGARAGGLDSDGCAALEAYGLHLGVAFQAVDDLLDFIGPSTGKAMFADLREGKMTYPLLVAVEREPQLAALLERALTGADLHTEVLAALQRTGAVESCREFARERAAQAIAELATLPESDARAALAAVAAAAVERQK